MADVKRLGVDISGKAYADTLLSIVGAVGVATPAKALVLIEVGIATLLHMGVDGEDLCDFCGGKIAEITDRLKAGEDVTWS